MHPPRPGHIDRLQARVLRAVNAELNRLALRAKSNGTEHISAVVSCKSFARGAGGPMRLRETQGGRMESASGAQRQGGSRLASASKEAAAGYSTRAARGMARARDLHGRAARGAGARGVPDGSYALRRRRTAAGSSAAAAARAVCSHARAAAAGAAVA